MTLINIIELYINIIHKCLYFMSSHVYLFLESAEGKLIGKSKHVWFAGTQVMHLRVGFSLRCLTSNQQAQQVSLFNAFFEFK